MIIAGYLFSAKAGYIFPILSNNIGWFLLSIDSPPTVLHSNHFVNVELIDKFSLRLVD